VIEICCAGFPEKTETELYLWIENNKAELTNENIGDDLRTAAVGLEIYKEGKMIFVRPVNGKKFGKKSTFG
jgi:hypothetical protein